MKVLIGQFARSAGPAGLAGPPAPGPAGPPGSPGRPPAGGVGQEITEIDGEKITVYQFQNGTLPPGEGSSDKPPVMQRLKDVFFPNPQTVSCDYYPTRKWSFCRDLFSTMAATATSAGVLAVFGVSPRWALLQAPLNMGKDWFCKTLGFGTSLAVPLADRNPRAWMMAGETIDHAGMLLEASAGLPGMFIPAFFGGPLVRIISGSMRGAAMAHIDNLQAATDNLGELRAKNGNQNFVSSLVGSVAGLALAQTAAGYVGPVAYPLVAAATGVLAVGSMAMMMRKLDYHPINEKALKRIIDGLETRGEVCRPENEAFAPVSSILEKETVVLGRSVRGLTDSESRLRELKNLYDGRNYLLDVKNGEPYVVLREGCSTEDRFAAAMQAVYVQRLRAENPALDDDSLMKASLRKTPDQPRRLLEKLKKAGWNVDLVRFRDVGKRARWGNDQLSLPFEGAGSGRG